MYSVKRFLYKKKNCFNLDQFKWRLKDTFGVDSFDPDYSKMLLWEDQPDTVFGATLSREVIKQVRQRETVYRMIEALRDNGKMKRRIMNELLREQILAKSAGFVGNDPIVEGSASMRDNMAAGSSVVWRGWKVVGDRMAMRDNTTARRREMQRDGENLELLREHMVEMMGEEQLRETIDLWEDPKRGEEDPEEEMQAPDTSEIKRQGQNARRRGNGFLRC